MTKGRRVEIRTVDDLIAEVKPIADSCTQRSVQLERLGNVHASRAWASVARSLYDICDASQQRRAKLDE